ncbi:hypothetical protein HDU76_005446, partial [Blyttiomyces sp. JEL0837]
MSSLSSSSSATSKMMTYLTLFSTLIISSLIPATLSLSATDYITQRGTNDRLGYFPSANLDPAIVSSSSFGRLHLTQLPNVNGLAPGQSYATPLLYTPSGSSQQLVIVTTENNNVYVLDANLGTVLASRNLDVPFNVAAVIDPTTNTLYAFAKTYAPGTTSGAPNARYRVHAMDAATLVERPNFPVDIEGTPAFNDPTHQAYFQAAYQLQRPALLFMQNTVLGSFGGHCDLSNFTGWVIGVDGTSGKVVSSFASAVATGGQKNGAGFWMSGAGPASDSSNRMFLVAGNGDTSPIVNPLAGNQDALVYGMSVIDLGMDPTTKAVKAKDFFMPYNYQALNGGDRDFGSGGVTLLPAGGAFGSTKIAVAAGKTGIVYFLNADNLGGFKQGTGGGDNVLQTINGPNAVYSQPGAYPLEGGYVYINPVGYPMQVYKYGTTSGGAPQFSFVAQTKINNRFGVGSPQTTSLNGAPGTGLVWFMDFSGTLFAYAAVPNADGTMNLVYSDSLNGNYPYNKFTSPAIGNGKVYVASSDGRLVIYGSPTNQPLTAAETDFGTVYVGTSGTATVKFTAQQNAITVTGYTLNNGNFSVSQAPALPVTLNINQTLSFVVTFNPTVAGAFTASLNLQTSAGTSALAYASLRANAVVNVPHLQLSPPGITFSGVVTGSGPVTANGIISNTGAKDLTITSVTLPSAPFTVLNAPAVGTVLASEASITISIVFNSKVDGSFSDKFTVGSDGGTMYILLTGTSAGPPVLKFYTQLLDGTYSQGLLDMEYGNVLAGTTKTLNVILSNAGATVMTVTKSKLPTSGNIIASSTALVEGQQVPANSN